MIGALSSSSAMSAGQMFMNFERMNNQNRFTTGILAQYELFGKFDHKKTHKSSIVEQPSVVLEDDESDN